MRKRSALLKSFVHTPISSDFLTFPPQPFSKKKYIQCFYSLKGCLSLSILKNLAAKKKHAHLVLSDITATSVLTDGSIFFLHFSISLDDSDLYKQLCARNVIFAQGASFQKAFHQHFVLSSWSASVIENVMRPVILQQVMDRTRCVVSVWLLSGYFASPNHFWWCSAVHAFLWDSQNHYFGISVILDN